MTRIYRFPTKLHAEAPPPRWDMPSWISVRAAFVLLTILSMHFPGRLHAQVFEKVYEFASPQGSYLDDYPSGELILGPDGCLYGATNGSSDYAGTIYKVTLSGTVTTLISFPDVDDGAPDGTGPSPLILGGDGFFYGTNTYGGSGSSNVEKGSGTLFRISPDGDFTKLADFSGTVGPVKGTRPGKLLAGMDGNFYGTTALGGANDLGVVFKMAPNGVVTTLVEFTGQTGSRKGSRPIGGLIQAPNGSLYGLTFDGGASDLGTVFKVSPNGSDFMTLVEFSGQIGAYKGAWPRGRLAMDVQGRMYGTTQMGGNGDLGTIFRLSSGNQFETLVEFTGAEGNHPGAGPYGTLLPDAEGNFYGTTSGSIFKMRPDGSFVFNTDVASFLAENPSSLAYGGDGNLYGASLDGYVFGTIFRMTPDGVGSTIATVGAGSSGIGELTSLTDGGDGSLYGTTSHGGEKERGTVFRLTEGGAKTTLLEFSGSFDEGNEGPTGARPRSLLKAPDGFFYGVTEEGGQSGDGTVFRMSPEGVHEVVHDFGETDGTDGRLPGSLIAGPNNSFYGTTRDFPGDVFKVTSDGSYEKLLTFTGPSGAYPGEDPNDLLLASDGNIYGTTKMGGIHNHGTLFRVTPGGAYTLLHSFKGESYASTVPWQNVLLKHQSNYSNPQFAISFGVTPNAAGMDGVTGLCHGSADAYTDLACIVRLNTAGHFDVRKGNVYTKDVTYPYTPGTTYRVTMDVDLVLQHYSVAVDGTTIATNYPFRSDPGYVQAIDYLAIRNESALHPGNHVVSDITLSLSGAHPNGKLADGGNGFLYGTTKGGGAAGEGTFYRLSVSPTVQFEELAEFSGNLGGSEPGDIFRQPDGTFLGTTGDGSGEFEYGALFKGTTSGALSNMTSFPNSGAGPPLPPLARTGNGLIYGISNAGSGFVYRVIFPGVPAIYDSGVYPEVASGSLFVQGKFSARGQVAEVYVDYGPSNVPIPSEGPFPMAKPLGAADGYLSTTLGTILPNLQPGLTYYYRYRATNALGTAFGPVMSFVTNGPPQATLLAATGIGPKSATLHGEVNAFHAATTVEFQFKKTPNLDNSPESVHVGVITGNTSKPASATLLGLDEGTTYYYRLRATNALGTVTAGTGSFTTISAPVLTLGSATALTTTKAKIEGTVDTKGSNVSTFIEWGVSGEDVDSMGNPTFPRSQGTTSSSSSGSALVAVSATLTNLTQGTTYHYRLRATGPGGTGYSDIGVFTLSILSGLDQEPPFDLPNPTGVLTVNLLPLDTGRWRLAGESRWRASGESATGLATGERLIEYLPVAGYHQPPSEVVEVFSGAASLVLPRYYLLASGAPAGTGGLQITLEPAAVRDAATPPRWRLLGIDQGDSGWRVSGETRSGLAPGSYLVECEGFPGRATPQPVSVQVAADATKLSSITYLVRPADQNELVAPVALADLSDESLPFAWVGQLRSPAGSSSGFAVKRRVVATAAHVVFDDITLAAVPDLQWFHQRHAGLNEPLAQIPRGYFLPTAYEAAREEDGVVPGEGTARSQHYDYAALYFLNDVARGGFSGFLASEGDENEFLTDPPPRLLPSEKILAGYATDITNAADRGKLHATRFTDPIPAFALSQVPGTIDGTSYGTYTTTAVTGRAGCSGGPLFVRHANGSFYPAAIYLGGSGQTVVRGIDRDVVRLFDLAETRSYGGGNSQDGGSTLTSTPLASSTTKGALKVVILPATLTTARWKLLDSYPLSESNHQETGLIPGDYKVSLTTVAGYVTPTDQPVTITKGILTTLTYTYQPSLTPIQQWRQQYFATTESTGNATDIADPDQDGRSNLDEYAAGTHPNNNSDYFRVLSTNRSPATFSVTVAGKKDRSYTLERRNPSTGSWIAIPPGTGPLATDTPALQLTDPSPPPGSGLYRVAVSPPAN